MPIQQTGTFNQATTPTVPGNFLSLFIAAARETTQEQGNLQSLVTRDTLPQGQGTTWNSPKFGSYTASSLSQGTDMAQQQAATSSNTVGEKSWSSGVWNTSPTIARMAGKLSRMMRLSPIVTSPCPVNIPFKCSIKVDLPAPFGPTNATLSPSHNVNETPRKAV